MPSTVGRLTPRSPPVHRRREVPAGAAGDRRAATGFAAQSITAAQAGPPLQPGHGRGISGRGAHRHGLEAGGLAQLGGVVGALPGELRLGAAEVAAVAVAVDRPAQVEVLDDPARREREVLADQALDLAVGNGAGAVGVDVDADRLGDADGVGELDLARGRPGRRRRCSWRRSGPCRRPSGRPSSGSLPLKAPPPCRPGRRRCRR